MIQKKGKDDTIADYARTDYALDCWDQVIEYLEEKGVEYANRLEKEKGVHDYRICMFWLLRVSTRLYHEVVVPGLIDLCRVLRLNLKATDYRTSVENTRYLEVKLSVDWNKVPTYELIALRRKNYRVYTERYFEQLLHVEDHM